MSGKTLIAGVGMSSFYKPSVSPSYADLAEVAVRRALKDAGIDYKKIQQVIASWVYGDSCAGQVPLYRVGLTGVPIFNVNNNCGSGSSAFFLARQAVESGAVDCAMALGFEQMKPGALGGMFTDREQPLDRFLAQAITAHHLNDQQSQLPSALMLFGLAYQQLQEEFGISDEAFAKVAVKARSHAANNPDYAIFRDPLSVDEVLASPKLMGKLTRLQACPPSCGAAAVIVCSEAFARKNGITNTVTVAANEAASDFEGIFNADSKALDLIAIPATKKVASRAFEKAGIGPEDVDVIELHDCFTPNEVAMYSTLGLCQPQDTEQFIQDGHNSYGGKYVICPSGGLLSKGHPLGATGLAQITELTWQLRGQNLGKRQVENAKVALQHNAGLGSAAYVTLLTKN